MKNSFRIPDKINNRTKKMTQNIRQKYIEDTDIWLHLDDIEP